MKNFILIGLCALFLAACESTSEVLKTNLIYASGRDVGITAESSPETAGFKVNFGMSSGNFVSAPVVNEAGGEAMAITGTDCEIVDELEVCDESVVDTFTSFQADVGEASISVGEVAGTGLAARNFVAALEAYWKWLTERE